jgi:hypothetical protein
MQYRIRTICRSAVQGVRGLGPRHKTELEAMKVGHGASIDEERWARILTLAVLAEDSATWSGGELFDPVAPIHDDGQAQP